MMKKIIIFIFLLFTVNVSVNADIISKIKLAYDLATLDDPAYMAMMDYIERFCNNNECESFRLPDVSMAPTLVKNDIVLVNKTAYFKRKPQRGDIMVFKHPREPSVPYIFRVVGLPGDHIAYYKKKLYINEKESEISLQTQYVLEGVDVKEYIEKKSDNEHRILLMPERPGLDAEYIVPDNSYFVMGDNRDNANDSRYWGTLESRFIIGKAIYILYGTDDHEKLNKKRLAIKL